MAKYAADRSSLRLIREGLSGAAQPYMADAMRLKYQDQEEQERANHDHQDDWLIHTRSNSKVSWSVFAHASKVAEAYPQIWLGACAVSVLEVADIDRDILCILPGPVWIVMRLWNFATALSAVGQR